MSEPESAADQSVEELAFFVEDDDRLVPTPMACSLWDANQMHGVALSGALARAAERHLATLGREDLLPSRYTVDLFRPATMDPCALSAETVREGSRICLVDVVLSQHDRPVARASTVFLKATESAPGEVWSPDERPTPPPEDVAPPTDQPRVPFFHSEAGWSQNFGEHQNASRKQTWQSAIPIVAGERATPFQAAAAIADNASMVTNWGSRGIEHINTDITLTLARRPDGGELGLRAADRVESAGVAVGTATIFDRTGPLGSVVVTSLSNTRRTVDFSQVEYTDAGERRAPGA